MTTCNVQGCNVEVDGASTMTLTKNGVKVIINLYLCAPHMELTRLAVGGNWKRERRRWYHR